LKYHGSKLPNKEISIEFYQKPSDMFRAKILYLYSSMLSAAGRDVNYW
jgi:hypothetical protein